MGARTETTSELPQAQLTAERDIVSQAISLGSHRLPGTLSIPSLCRGLVIFAHGSGSSRLSPRNQSVARALNRGGLATVLFDLLTAVEAADKCNVFDVGRLGQRLVEAMEWAEGRQETNGLPIGLFGASTGAAAALIAAAERPDKVAAVVARGGRPDLTGRHLAGVKAPTLLIVGGADHAVIEFNRQAMRMLRCERQMVLIPGATHLFEEPGALDQVIELSAAWFDHQFKARAH